MRSMTTTTKTTRSTMIRMSSKLGRTRRSLLWRSFSARKHEPQCERQPTGSHQGLRHWSSTPSRPLKDSSCKKLGACEPVLSSLRSRRGPNATSSSASVHMHSRTARVISTSSRPCSECRGTRFSSESSDGRPRARFSERCPAPLGDPPDIIILAVENANKQTDDDPESHRRRPVRWHSLLQSSSPCLSQSPSRVDDARWARSERTRRSTPVSRSCDASKSTSRCLQPIIRTAIRVVTGWFVGMRWRCSLRIPSPGVASFADEGSRRGDQLLPAAPRILQPALSRRAPVDEHRACRLREVAASPARCTTTCGNHADQPPATPAA